MVTLPLREFRKEIAAEVKSSELPVKFLIREKAKENPAYHKRIKLEHPYMDLEEKLTLGRWVFGIPGYAGHYAESVEDGKVLIWLPPIKEVFELVQKALLEHEKEGRVEIVKLHPPSKLPNRNRKHTPRF